MQICEWVIVDLLHYDNFVVCYTESYRAGSITHWGQLFSRKGFCLIYSTKYSLLCAGDSEGIVPQILNYLELYSA